MSALDLDADLVELAPAPSATAAVAALREMAFRADAWTPQETDRLRTLFAADTALADIATDLGRGRAAIAERVTLLGLRRNSTRTWTELDDAELVRRYGDEPTAAIASDLGRSCSAVYARTGLIAPSLVWKLAPTTEIGLDLKKRSPMPQTMVIGLANGRHGYLPTPEQHRLGGYETWIGTNVVQEDASVILTTQLLEMLAELKKAQ